MYNKTDYNKYWITKKDWKLITKDYKIIIIQHRYFLLLIQLEFGIWNYEIDHFNLHNLYNLY